MKKTITILSASLLVFGVTTVSASGTLTDVSPDAWYYPTVKEVSSVGIMKGYQDGTFHPDQYITRAELAQVISNTVNTIKTENTKENVDKTINAATKAIPSTVRIDTADNRYGAGFFVSPNLVVTNWHVAKYGNIHITLSTGEMMSTCGEVIKKDESRDLALIKVDTKNTKIKPLEFATAINVGEEVLAIGTPQGLSFNVTKGIISSDVVLNDNTFQYIRTDAAINPGNSGGALIDMNGNVVGVVSAKVNFDGSSEGLGFALPYNLVKKFVEGK